MLCSAPLEFALSGVLWPRFLAFPCFCKSWSASSPEEDSGLELDLERFLALVYRLRGPTLGMPGTVEDLLTPSEVPDSHLDPQRFQVPAYSL